jgi:hypothetical protein
MFFFFCDFFVTNEHLYKDKSPYYRVMAKDFNFDVIKYFKKHKIIVTKRDTVRSNGYQMSIKLDIYCKHGIVHEARGFSGVYQINNPKKKLAEKMLRDMFDEAYYNSKAQWGCSPEKIVLKDVRLIKLTNEKYLKTINLTKQGKSYHKIRNEKGYLKTTFTGFNIIRNKSYNLSLNKQQTKYDQKHKITNTYNYMITDLKNQYDITVKLIKNNYTYEETKGNKGYLLMNKTSYNIIQKTAKNEPLTLRETKYEVKHKVTVKYDKMIEDIKS